MPTWLLLVALLLLPVVILLTCEYTGMDPYSSAAIAVSVNFGPATVLIYRGLAEWTAVSIVHFDPRAEWAIIGTPPAIVATMVVWALYRSTREKRAGWAADSWCARCHTALYTDHAGRYYSSQDGYLCPPELRDTNGRRHQPIDATIPDRHQP